MSEILQLFPPSIAQVIEGILKSTGEVWGKVWWFALPLVSFFVFWEFWVLYIQFKFISAIEWKLLEIRVPKNILKNPKAMEQIFAAAHAPYSYGLRFSEKYWEGRVEYWMSFEFVGRAGEVHFYLRLPKQYRNLMESAIYAQYPEAEVIEVQDDYRKQMPRTLPDKTYDLYGAELILRNPDPYPIRTYPMFEEAVEEQRVDPMATIAEAMSRLKSDEQIWIQILARPTGDDWKKKGEELINKIAGRKSPARPKGFLSELLGTIEDPIRELIDNFIESVQEAFSGGPITTVKSQTKTEREQADLSRIFFTTPLEKEILEGISRKIGKLGFQTTIRFLYIDRRDAFSRDNVAAVTGAFRQYNTQHMNLIRPDKRTMTAAVHGLFKRTKLNYRKRVIFEKYRDLSFNRHKPILNIEELATLYHFPITGVNAPMLERIESKKGSPPPTLPIAE